MANGNSNPNINRGLNGQFPLSYMGVNPSSPAQTVFEQRAPTPNDSKNYLLGTLWIWQTATVNASPPPPLIPAQIWMLTALAGGQATWTQLESSAAGTLTFDGDVGTAIPTVGGVINFKATPNSGSSVEFSAAVNTINLLVTDINQNTIIGGSAGNSSLTAASSTALGYQALKTLTSGNANIAVGSAALTALTSGADNVAIGSLAGEQLVTGSFNTFLGDSAGFNYTTSESSNICIGYNTEGTITESHVLRIGNGTGSSTAGNIAAAYISGIDGVNVASTAQVVTEHSNQLGTAIITAGTGISVTPGANIITIAVTGAGISTSSILGVSNVVLNATSGVTYASPFGSSSGGTQSVNEFILPIGGTFSNLYVDVFSNSNTATGTVTVNRNGSNTAIVSTITASTTGVFSDTTHSQTYVAGDTIQFQMSQATTSGSSGTISIAFKPT